MNSWFYKIMDQQIGPISSEELRRKAQSGVITPDTLIRTSDSEEWRTADHVRGLFTSAQGAIKPLPPPPTKPRGSDAESFVDRPTPNRDNNYPPHRLSESSHGAADRLLQQIFASAKYLSVIVILCGLLTIAICLAVLVASAPEIATVPTTYEVPTVAEYEDEVAREGAVSPTDNESESTPSMNSVYDVAKTGLAAKYPSIAPQLTIIFNHFEEDAESVSPNRFIKDFSAFLEQAQKKWGTNYRQFAGAAMWFAQNYLDQVRDHEYAVESIERVNESSSIAAAARRTMLGMISAAALAFILVFLVLPLLIEIEQNTRSLPRRSHAE